jgi:hypothetical protein
MEFAKRHQKTQTKKQDYQASLLEETWHGEAWGWQHPYGEAWWWQQHAVGFSAAGTGRRDGI